MERLSSHVDDTEENEPLVATLYLLKEFKRSNIPHPVAVKAVCQITDYTCSNNGEHA